ncbi:hypothetical protein BD626DRAFT_575809 [Schizophyllum amplum]|uniref:Uncharacterized protein n=1 Tax=Schizophyllum amplum TaxID=97359 RepID=A0A550BV11_9AGAR|nr:hypothetical protein BD626DRAFT_575809 [Auriculariopsis ampla]
MLLDDSPPLPDELPPPAEAEAPDSCDRTPLSPPAAPDPEKTGRSDVRVWVNGTKLAFFQRYLPQWRACDGDSKARGRFYDWITLMFSRKYGFDFDINTDLDQDIPDPDPKCLLAVEEEGVAEDVVKQRQAWMKSMRKRIQQWYLDHARSKKQRVDPDKILLSLVASEHKNTRKPSDLEYYSRKYYDERVADTVNEEWSKQNEAYQAALQTWRESGEDPQTRPATLERITTVRSVTKRRWEQEPWQFREELRRQRDADHQHQSQTTSAALQRTIPKTVEDYIDALEVAPLVLQPLADALARKFGLLTSILICGPMPDEGGRIGMLGAHSGRTPDLQQIWPEAEHQTYSHVSDSFIGFAHRIYNEECRTRARPGTEYGTPAPASAYAGTEEPSASSQSPVPMESSSAASAAPLQVDCDGDHPTVSDSEEALQPDQSEHELPVFHEESQDQPRPASVVASAPSSPSVVLPPAAARVAAHASHVHEDNGQDHSVWSTKPHRDWPDHLSGALEACARGRTWGMSWAATVSAFLRYENFVGRPRDDLGRKVVVKDLRPKEYVTWARGGVRRYQRTVNIDEVPVFREKWWLWWAAIVSMRAGVAGGGLIDVETFLARLTSPDDWQGLELTCGRNGLVQVVMTLLWWGEAVNTGVVDAKNWHDWDLACDDFRQTLEALVQTARKPKRCQAQGLSTAPAD